MKLPTNPVIETQILGCMLMSLEAIHETERARITEEDFYSTRHKIIFQSIIELYQKGDGVDIVTVSDDLNTKGKIEIISGGVYLMDLISGVASTTNLKYYIKLLLETSRKRKLFLALLKTSQIITEEKGWEEVKVIAKEEIYKALEQQEESESIGMLAMTKEIESVIEKAHETKGKNRGLQIGFPRLTKICPVIQKNYIVLGGAPRMGKSALCLTIMYNLSRIEKKTSLFISCEMTKELVGMRLASLSSGKSISDLYAGRYRKEEVYLEELAQSKIIVDETGSTDIDAVIAKIKECKRQHPDLCFVGIDHIGYLTGRKTEMRQQELTLISALLARLAKELNIVVLIITQLIKDAIERKPGLSDIRESGALAQDADVVWFLYRNPEKTPDKADLRIAKQRNGEDGKVIGLGFENKQTRFFEQEGGWQ